MDRWEIEKKIVMKALKDPAFKQKLLANPKETIRNTFKDEKGIASADFNKINIRIIEEKQGEWTMSLPHLSKELQNLSESELEKLFAAAGSQPDSWACGG